MGIRESRISFFPYEEVQRRVNDDELKRLRMAFKRLAGASGIMSKVLFLREVLGESVPLKLAEQIYLAFGGTSKGIYFKDLVCGLALLTRGSLLDRLKFIFEVYSNDGSQVLRDDMESLLLASEGGKIPEQIMQMFATTDRLGSQEFCEWLRRNPDSITLSKWLVKQGNALQLTDYGETPTFYQTIAKFTGLQELDIIELEKKYWYLKAGTKTGKFDMETFTPLISSCVPESLSKALFNAFDENQDGHIDFREIACGISTCCRGPIAERFAFTFKIFDQDRDGLLSEQEILAMIKVMVELKSENVPHSSVGEEVPEINPTLLVDEILNDYDADKDGFITLEEYKKWATTHSLSRLVLEILFQICHVIFGLRPATRKDEYQVIWGWLDRENFRGLIPGTTWYLIAMDWWKEWKEFVGCQKSLMARSLSTSALERNGVGPLASSLSSTTSHAWDKIESTMKKTLVTRRASQPLRSVAPLVGVNGHVPNGIMPKPGTIINSFLVEHNVRKIQSLTGDGGKLKCTIPLVRGRDFEIVPEPVWKALVQWYTGSPALPRNVIIPTDGDPTPVLELFPRLLLLYRHAQPPAKNSFQSWSGVGFGLNGLHLNSSTASTAASVVTPRRQLTYTAVFSRMNTVQQLFDFLCQRLRLKGEDIRLWNMADENNLQLLDEDQFGQTLEDSSIEDQHPILIEIRNRDMSWPEEMTSLALNKAFQDKRPHGKGMTGLSNLGNTCFMNSAIQCMSNTTPLTSYFTDGYHLYELNKVNPLGMKGNIAKRYGEVVLDLWNTSCRSIAPLKLRWTIGRYAPRFNGFQQQDSQEFLAFLLDGLHEDLNRVHSKPYVELKDSDGRPDEEVAKEAWDNHLKRNKSIVVDLFQGQLKSCVRCLQCNHVSVRFDPYTFLSLPIPMDNSIYVECIVVTLDGVVPIKYGLLLSTDDKYKKLKKQLAKLCGLTQAQLLMVEVIGAVIKSQPLDSQKVRSSLSGILYAFVVPPSPAVENPTSCSVAVATSNEATMDVQAGGNVPAGTPVDEGATITTEPTTKEAEQPREARTPRSQLVRSPSRSSSEKSLGGSLKLPCLSRQTSDDDDDDENIEVASEVSGRSSMGLLRQLSPRFIRAFGNKKSGSSWNGSESSGGTSELRDQSAMSSTKTTPCHSRNTSMSSTSGTPVHAGRPQVFHKPRSYVVGMHRKLMRMDVYFIAPQKNRPSLFGSPLIIPCIPGTKKSQLYSAVWQQVSRFVSAPPPGEDVTDDRDTGYPFELKSVSEGGLSCAVCPWYKFCHGCTVKCNDEEFNCNCHSIAIEWEPTTLHLRYQSSQEKVFTEHESVERSRRLQTEPIDLYECFKAFTKEEELGEDELWYCSKCKKHQLASKKLDIWSLPPILIIHLKRFQFMNGRWVKSNKVVNFPMKYFDPSEFVVKRPTFGGYDSGEDGTCVRTVNVKTVDKDVRDRECCPQILMETTTDKDPVSVTDATLHKGSSDSGLSSNSSGCCSDESHVSKNDSDELNEDSGYSSQSSLQTGAHQGKHSGKVHPVVSNETSNKLPEELDTVKYIISKDAGSESSVERCEIAVPVCDECLLNEPCNCSTSSKASDMNSVGINSVDLFDVASVTSTHDVLPVLKLGSGVEQDSGMPQMLYNLYTISSHAGVMGGGHYVSFSKNPNGKWYCFNDSSCKETTSERVQKESPYLLFFERVGMDYKHFLPDVKDRTPESNDEDEIDNEFKKACVLQ